MKKLNFYTILIAFLGAAGGFLVALGLVEPESLNTVTGEVKTIFGAVMTIVSVLMSYLKDNNAKATEDAKNSERVKRALAELPPDKARKIMEW